MNQSKEKILELADVKTTTQFDIGPRKKRLQSVRVRNALRNNSREKLRNASSSSTTSSTSDDSVDDNHYAYKRRRTTTTNFDNKQIQVGAQNNNQMANNGHIITKEPNSSQMSIIGKYETQVAKKPANNDDDRLNNNEQSHYYCSQSIIGNSANSEDLSENSNHHALLVPQGKSDSMDSSNHSSTNNSNNSNLDGEEDVDDAASSISRIGSIFQCPLCVTKHFRQVNLLISHLLYGHHLHLNNNDLSNLKKYLILHEQNDISITVTPPKFSRPFTLARCRKAKRKLFTEKLVVTNPIPSDNNYYQSSEESVENKEIINSKARIDGTFTCLKCDSTFGDEQGFFDHIKNDHVWTKQEILRLKENTAGAHDGETEPVLEFWGPFWCPECSDAYITKSSLSKHLKANHCFVDDVQLYLEKIGYSCELPLDEFQCSICYSVEDGYQEFENHVRSHGLAFLRRQNLLSKLRKFK